MTQHTQGPWEVHEHNHVDGEFWCTIGHNGRGPIADIIGAEGNKTEHYQPVSGMKYLVTPVSEQKANARLIAAAPELLDALQLVANCVTDSQGGVTLGKINFFG